MSAPVVAGSSDFVPARDRADGGDPAIQTPARELVAQSAPETAAPSPHGGAPGPGHLSHLTDIERACYFAAVAEALALLNAEDDR